MNDEIHPPQVTVLEGEPLDKRLREQVETLKHCVSIAADALAFAPNPVSRQALRAIREHCQRAGIKIKLTTTE